jgi:hypothetical protein
MCGALISAQTDTWKRQCGKWMKSVTPPVQKYTYSVYSVGKETNCQINEDLHIAHKKKINTEYKRQYRECGFGSDDVDCDLLHGIFEHFQ